jgi:hypothetical protein
MEKIKLPYNLDLRARPFQREILLDKRQNKVLVLPRRHGKTSLAIAYINIEAIKHPNHVYHYVFPFFRQAKEAVWIAPNMINKLVPTQAIRRKTQQPMIIYYHNGSQIHLKGADSPDSLRSLDCHGVVFDEPAQIKPEVFDEIYYPILAANGGWAWFIGTPKDNGRAYFGFSTDRRVRTSHRDSLILTLAAVTALPGQGSYHEGILRAGTYHVSGSYSSLYGRRWQPFDALALWGGAPIAFMQCWDATWPLDSTVYEGWKGSKSPDELPVGRSQSLTAKRGTTWRPCGSHL